jgi:hypothetical protein
MLHAITTMVKDGNPEIFKASLDLAPILMAVTRHHQRMHGSDVVKVAGFFDSIASIASKIGHSNIVKSIASSVKHSSGAAVIHSPVIIPSVSLNAATAYATAKAAINTLDEAKQVEAHVKRIVAVGSPKAKAVAQTKVPQIKALMAKKALVQKSLASLDKRAKMGDKDALAAQKVFGIVLKSHVALGNRVTSKKVQRGMPGLMITHTGRIVPGHYIANAANKKLGQQAIYNGKQLQRGPYEAA